MDAPAARRLSELIGADVMALASELDKLNAYANGETVREADVRELVTRAKEQLAYFLADAIVGRQGAKAARLLRELLADEQHPQMIIATVAGRYRRIAIVKEMSDSGAGGSAIASRLSMKPGFGVDRLLEQASGLSWPALRAAYARIIQAERDHKSGLMDEEVALELLVQDLATPVSRAA
jgi:DNA polymerase-3 subunit delta